MVVQAWSSIAAASLSGFVLVACAAEPQVEPTDQPRDDSAAAAPSAGPSAATTPPHGPAAPSPSPTLSPESSASVAAPSGPGGPGPLPSAAPEPASPVLATSEPAPSVNPAQAAPESPASGDTPDPLATPAANDDSVLEALQEHLAVPAADRPPLSEQPFATLGLSKDGATRVAALLWDDFAARIEAERRQEHEARVISWGEHRLRFDFRTFGDAPPEGRSLFISLHGGGNADPSVNDEQWENQKILYEPEEGIYLAPRAPTDTWNLWHEAHIDPLFERLITNLIVLEGVNPDRVYVMGYSAGGDGVYQLGPRMADHWAAASAMAGHPNEAKPLSLRNIGFTIHVGALDTAYDRNLVAEQWDEQLNELESADPDGYPHVVEVHAGKPHWMDLEDAVAVPWMAEFTRNPHPERVVWYQDDITHSRSYWLAVDEPVGETLVEARADGQTIEIESEDLNSVRVRLSDVLLDLDQPVAISANGVEMYSGPVERTALVLHRTLEERGDPSMMYSAEIAVEW